MAGIEKICEYSGEYPGYHMYRYKRDSIQILPKYRKLFRDKQATLIFFKSDDICYYRVNGLVYSFDPNDDRYKFFDGTWYIWNPDRKNPEIEIAHKITVFKEHTYALIVPELPGEVDGIYMNWSYNKGTVIRKLKRIIGKTLKIEKSDLTYREYKDSIMMTYK